MRPWLTLLGVLLLAAPLHAHTVLTLDLPGHGQTPAPKTVDLV